MIQEVTDANFALRVLQASMPVLVECFTDWAEPSRTVKETVEAIAESYQGRVLAFRLDCDRNPETIKRYRIVAVPTVIIFDDGKEQERAVQVAPVDMICEMIDKRLAAKGKHETKTRSKNQEPGVSAD